MKTIRIDDALQIPESDVTHKNLKIMFGTGISMYSKNQRGDRVGYYRTGVQTQLGDIEISVWIKLAEKLIEKENSQKLYAELLEWAREYGCIKPKTEADIKEKALDYYVSAIYDNKSWCDYISFNEKYYPEKLLKEK